MTKICIFRTADGEYQGFTCKGHAGFAPSGKDVVCAAVSVLAINTLNSLEELTGAPMEVTADEKSGYINCRFTGSLSKESRLLMDSFLLGCREIDRNYGGKYFRLEFKEV